MCILVFTKGNGEAEKNIFNQKQMITFRPFYPIPVLENNDNDMENDIISIIMSINSMRKRSRRCDKNKESFS